MLEMLSAAIAAVDPRRVVGAAFDGESSSCWPGIRLPMPGDRGNLHVLALGKAAVAMTWGVSDALDIDPALRHRRHPRPGPGPHRASRSWGGPTPPPTSTAPQRGPRLLSAAASAREGDVVLVLVSGGGSACAEVPAPGLTIEQISAATDALLASGAPIGEINIVRRSLSLLKGGGLAAAANPARVVTLIVSDVVGNDLRHHRWRTDRAGPDRPPGRARRDRQTRIGRTDASGVLAYLAKAPLPSHACPPRVRS